MDYETKILLGKLIEAVNSPDRWAIGITVVNALIMAWLGWRQYQLQKRQTEAQEYDLYRRMYTQVFESDFFNKTILLRIVAILTSNEDKQLRLKLIEDVWKEYETRSEEFTECTIDMELKQCGEGIDAKCYYEALQASRRVILMFKYFIEQELLRFNPSLVYDTSMDHTTPPETLINIIMQIYKGRNPFLLKKKLLAFVETVEKTNQSQILETIKKRITPNKKIWRKIIDKWRMKCKHS